MSNDYKRITILNKKDGINEGKSYKDYLEEAKKNSPGLYKNYRDDGSIDCNLGSGVKRN